jgi:hypothetical protein
MTDNVIPASAQAFSREAAELPFDAEALVTFNARIQVDIEAADRTMRENRALALALSEIKFQANKKFDQLRRARQESQSEVSA